MPRKNDRANRSDPREAEFWRSKQCTEDDPCARPQRKPSKNKRKKNRTSNDVSD